VLVGFSKQQAVREKEPQRSDLDWALEVAKMVCLSLQWSCPFILSNASLQPPGGRGYVESWEERFARPANWEMRCEQELGDPSIKEAVPSGSTSPSEGRKDEVLERAAGRDTFHGVGRADS
jgi:hypothetical protein